MNQEEIDEEVLDELNKGACMGMDAIYFILSKVKDQDLRNELDNQYSKYKQISNKVRELYKNYSNESPDETSIINKTRTFYGIQLNTIKDNTTSKLAEMLIEGNNMGIIKGRKLLNKNEASPEVQKLLKEFIDMQQDATEILKNFL